MAFSAATYGGSNQVWVGNIPYEATEDDLLRLLSSIGPVASIRVSVDKDTGQSKGFAFCEYEDPESCTLAVAHLNGTVFGGRTLRIDYSSSEQLKHQPDSSRHYTPGGHTPVNASLASAVAAARPNVARTARTVDAVTHSGTPRMSDQEFADRVKICKLVESLTASQLLYVLGHLQRLVLRSPEAARSLLRGVHIAAFDFSPFYCDFFSEHPAFCYAVLHAQFICGMIDEPFVALPEEHLVEQAEEDFQRRQATDLKAFYERHAQALEAEAEKQTAVRTTEEEAEPSNVSSSLNFGQDDQVEPHQDNRRENYSTPSSSLQTPGTLPSHSAFPTHYPSSKTFFQSPVVVSPPLCTLDGGGMPSAPPSILGGSYEQQAAYQSSVPPQPSAAPEPLAASHSSAAPQSGLIDQLLAHPEILEQLLSITPEQEAQWPPQEREELQIIRTFLYEHGFFPGTPQPSQT